MTGPIALERFGSPRPEDQGALGNYPPPSNVVQVLMVFRIA